MKKAIIALSIMATVGTAYALGIKPGARGETGITPGARGETGVIIVPTKGYFAASCK